jgi:hypothetical protein
MHLNPYKRKESISTFATIGIKLGISQAYKKTQAGSAVESPWSKVKVNVSGNKICWMH